MQGQPLLSICIPTWNRSSFLDQNLKQIQREIATLTDPKLVEVVVSDNASDDATPETVVRAQQDGMTVRSIRNDRNIGSDGNIAQCFNTAQGDYVLVLSDDDLLYDGALVPIIAALEDKSVGVLNLRAYGYEDDFRAEYPGTFSTSIERVRDLDTFIVQIGMTSTLVSANVIAKHLLGTTDARQFCGHHLVQAHLVYQAAIAGACNARSNAYLLACKRNNSGGYSFSQVFVEDFGKVLDDLPPGIGNGAVNRLYRKLLLGYYPFYVWRLRRTGKAEINDSWARFYKRFRKEPLFWIFVAPTLRLPRPIGLVWGAMATIFGRLLNGELRRGLYFARHRMQRLLNG